MAKEEIDSSYFCDQDYNVWLLFSHTWRAMFKAREKELAAYDLTPEQAEVLLATQALGPKATPAAISRSTLREPHTISGLIERMAAKGLITRTKDLNRRNLIRISLTEKGQKAFEFTTRRKVIFDIIGQLSNEERRTMCCMLERLQATALNLLEGKARPVFPPPLQEK